MAASQPVVIMAAESYGHVAHDPSLCNFSRTYSGIDSNGTTVDIFGARCDNATSTVRGCVKPLLQDVSMLWPKATAPPLCGGAGLPLVTFGTPPPANASIWVDMFPAQRVGALVWSAMAQNLRMCDVDLSTRRVSTASEWFFKSIAVVLDPTVECLSLPLPLFEAVVKWTNATCATGAAARTRPGGCVLELGHAVVADLYADSESETGLWRIPLTPGDRQCLQGHNSTEWESVRVGRRAIATLNAEFNVSTAKLRLPTVITRSEECVRALCPEYMTYIPRSDSCVDVSCVRVWFKETVDGECRNLSSVVAVVSLLVALISLGEMALVYARRQLDVCVNTLEAR